VGLLVLGATLEGACLFPSLDGLGGADAGDAAEDGVTAPDGGRFCASLTPAPAFCEDFDEPDGAPDLSKWLGYSVNGGASLSVDDTFALSSPRSLLAVAPALSSSSAEAAVFPAAGPTPTARAELVFDVDLVPGNSDATLCSLVSPSATTVYLIVGPGGIHVGEGPYDGAYPYHPTHAVDWSAGWVHVDLTLNRTATGATTSLAVNAAALETNYACDSRFEFGPEQVGLGYIYDGSPADARQAHIDDVVLYDE